MANDINALMADHYQLAYQIAGAFSSPFLTDDVKENFAIKSLQKAAEKFDATKGMKFSSYLYMWLNNELKTEHTRVKKLPMIISEVTDEESEHKSIFDLLDSKAMHYENIDRHAEMLSTLEQNLTERQRKLLNMQLNPAPFIEEYTSMYKPSKAPKKLTWTVMTAMMGVSSAMVAIELKRIRETARQVLNIGE